MKPGDSETGISIIEDDELYRGQLPNPAMSKHNRCREIEAELALAATSNIEPRPDEPEQDINE